MATTIAGVAMAGGGGFVLKSVRNGKITETEETFSVQNEGDFCIIACNVLSSNSSFKIRQIDDIPINIDKKTDIVFGKNIVVQTSGSNFYYNIFEYGPAE